MMEENTCSKMAGVYFVALWNISVLVEERQHTFANVDVSVAKKTPASITVVVQFFLYQLDYKKESNH